MHWRLRQIFHTYHKDYVIRSLITTKHNFIGQIPTRMVSSKSSRYEISQILSIVTTLHMCKRTESFSSHINKNDSQVFNTVHLKKHRFHAIFKVFRTQNDDTKTSLAGLKIPVQNLNAKENNVLGHGQKVGSVRLPETNNFFYSSYTRGTASGILCSKPWYFQRQD